MVILGIVYVHILLLVQPQPIHGDFGDSLDGIVKQAH